MMKTNLRFSWDCFLPTCPLTTTARPRAVGWLAGALLLVGSLANGTEVRLNRIIYPQGSLITATVTVDPTVAVTNKYLYLSSGTSGDAEVVPLIPAGGSNVFVTQFGVPLSLNDGSAPVVQQDGALSVKPNEYFFAFFYPREYDPKRPNEAQAFADFGVLELNDLKEPVVIVKPEVAMSTDELNPPPGGKKVATLAHLDGLAVQLPLDELIVYPLDDAQFQQILAETGGTLILDDVVPPLPGEKEQPPRYRLVRVDPAKGDLAHLMQMRAMLGETDTLLVSNPELLKLYALTLQLQLDGYLVSPNPRLQYMGAPSTRDGTPAQPIHAMSTNASEATELFSNPLFGVREAMAFLALWDRDAARVRVGVLDMGFAPNWDFRGYNPGAADLGLFQRDLEGGTSSAVGTPTVGASFFGDPTWHGNGVVTTLGGVLNNGWGGVGIGGQVAVPMLYKMGLRTYAFEIGRGIRMAVNDGATIINISAGYPCTIQSSFGGFRICSPGQRALFCTGLTAAMAAATAVVCVVPIVGWIACPFAAAGTVAVSTFCFTTLLAGDPRGPMEEGVAYAVAHGVTVVSVAGNAQDAGSLGRLCDFLRCGRQDAGAWEIVPGVLDGVLCVGAADATSPYANNQYYGDRVDVWAPVGGAFWTPPTTAAVTGPDQQQRHDGFSGTSAAAPFVAGVVAMMQAVNPALNPHTPGLTPSQISAIPGQIRTMLRATATPASALPVNPSNPDVGRRRNLIQAYAAVRAAAQGVIPNTDLLGYDPSLGFNELPPNPTYDTDGTARDIDAGALPAAGTEFRDTILALPGFEPPGGGAAFVDEDHYIYRMPASPPGVYDFGRVEIRQPYNALNPLTVLGWPGTLIATNATEMVTEFRMPRVYQGTPTPLRVTGSSLSDTVYKIRFYPARWVAAGLPPDRFDQPNGNPPFSDNNERGHAVPLGGNDFPWQASSGGLGGGMLSETGMVINVPGLNFHSTADVDWFQLTYPPGLEPLSCGSCAPYLLIEAAAGVSIDVYSGTNVLVHSAQRQAQLLCNQYRGRSPLRFVLRPTVAGQAIEYTLRVSWLYRSYLDCNYQRLFAPNVVFPFVLNPSGRPPGWGDPDPILPTDFSTDTLGRILTPQRLGFSWGGSGSFNLAALIPAGESCLIKLFNAGGVPVAQTGTADLIAGASPSRLSLNGKAQLLLSVPQLAPGDYFLEISYLHFGAPLSLYPPRSVLPADVPGYEDLVGLSFVPGDFNGDGLFDQADLDQLQTFLKSGKPPTPEQLRATDANADGKLNDADLQSLQQALSQNIDLRASWPGYTPPLPLQSAVDATDSDGDGMPDWWEIAVGLDPQNPADAKLDNDKDGRTNLEEYLSDTNPNDPQSVLQLRLAKALKGKSQLLFSPPTGRSFTIQYADELGTGNWYRLADIEEQFYPRDLSFDLDTKGSRFYRVVTPAGQCDQN